MTNKKRIGNLFQLSFPSVLGRTKCSFQVQIPQLIGGIWLR